MVKYDHRKHELSDWLLELEQRLQLGEVEADRAKITCCQLLIGATGNSILAGLDAETTWEIAKENSAVTVRCRLSKRRGMGCPQAPNQGPLKKS